MKRTQSTSQTFFYVIVCVLVLGFALNVSPVHAGKWKDALNSVIEKVSKVFASSQSSVSDEIEEIEQEMNLNWENYQQEWFEQNRDRLEAEARVLRKNGDRGFEPEELVKATAKEMREKKSRDQIEKYGEDIEKMHDKCLDEMMECLSTKVNNGMRMRFKSDEECSDEWDDCTASVNQYLENLKRIAKKTKD